MYVLRLLSRHNNYARTPSNSVFTVIVWTSDVVWCSQKLRQRILCVVYQIERFATPLLWCTTARRRYAMTRRRYAMARRRYAMARRRYAMALSLGWF